MISSESIQSEMNFYICIVNNERKKNHFKFIYRLANYNIIDFNRWVILEAVHRSSIELLEYKWYKYSKQ